MYLKDLPILVTPATIAPSNEITSFVTTTEKTVPAFKERIGGRKKTTCM